MKVKFKCEPMSDDWLQRCHEKGWTKDTNIPEKHQRANGNDYPPRDYEDLKQRLLKVAGQAL